MGTWSYIKGVFIATWTGIRHFFHPRMTLRYPEQKLDLEGPGYKYNAKQGVGLPGFKGRHILYFEKCTGCQLCAIACDGVAVAIDMQKVTKGKPQNKKDIWPAVDYGRCVFCGLCVDPETVVITNPGVQPLRAISIGDLVLTHTGEYRPVTKIWDMLYTGPLYRIYVYGKPEPLLCTKDHRILAVSRARGNRRDGRLLRTIEPLLMTLPSRLKAGDYLVNPIVKKMVSVDKYEADIPFGPRNGTKHLVLEATPDLFRFVGYYISEGSCNKSAVYFSLHKKETDIIEDLISLAREFFGKTPTLTKATGDGVCVVISSVMAVGFFAQFGRGAQNKKVADWVFHSDKARLLQLAKGIWLGDGCKVRQPRQKYINFRTSSRTLAFQEQSILARLGIVALIESEDQKGRLRSYHVNVFGRWAIGLAKMWDVDLDYHPSKFVDKFHLNEDYVYLPIRKIETVDVTNHRVMDVTVEDVHTFAPLGLATSNCVDACPFDALDMTNDYELSALDKTSLKYTPDMLAIPPKLEGKKYKVKLDTEKGEVRYG
jgi:formate hydrogenlyase subunit 6/NADH:ubiquinone oxidoreductase subunit I